MEFENDAAEASEGAAEDTRRTRPKDLETNVEEENEPTPPEVYVEADSSEDIPKVFEGDPGTYIGDYRPVYKESDAGRELPEDNDPDGEVRP